MGLRMERFDLGRNTSHLPRSWGGRLESLCRLVELYSWDSIPYFRFWNDGAQFKQVSQLCSVLILRIKDMNSHDEYKDSRVIKKISSWFLCSRPTLVKTSWVDLPGGLSWPSSFQTAGSMCSWPHLGIKRKNTSDDSSAMDAYIKNTPSPQNFSVLHISFNADASQRNFQLQQRINSICVPLQFLWWQRKCSRLSEHLNHV